MVSLTGEDLKLKVHGSDIADTDIGDIGDIGF